MGKTIFEYTLEELKDLWYLNPGKKEFDSVIIVPMDEVHDSGYRCMKYVLCDTKDDIIVGVIGGYSDVLHLNGIGGYGLSFERNLASKTVPIVDWNIDCLDTSRCLRLFGPKMILKDHIQTSSIEIYDANS